MMNLGKGAPKETQIMNVQYIPFELRLNLQAALYYLSRAPQQRGNRRTDRQTDKF